jgi:pSer/pThr/pTyr-binding forkhead associated (FHA) protein
MSWRHADVEQEGTMALLEVFRPQGRELRSLEAPETGDGGFADFIVGRSPEVWLSLEDKNVSKLHAKLSPVAGRWAIEDLGSRNGTWVNGDRIVQMRIFCHGDYIQLGSTTLHFRDPSLNTDSTTSPKRAAPPLTPREREVLIELCRPFFSSNLVKKATGRRDMATAMYTGEAAIQQHLGHLYDKFFIDGVGERRDLLAVAVIEAGIIGPKDYRDGSAPGGEGACGK